MVDRFHIYNTLGAVIILSQYAFDRITLGNCQIKTEPRL